MNVTTETCLLCGCIVHRSGSYGQPSIEGRSHASAHHFVAERFFGRSANRPGELREALPLSETYRVFEGTAGVFCYECHEELLHNPILLPDDIAKLRQCFVQKGITETEKTNDRILAARRVALLHEVIQRGISSMQNDSKNLQ